MTLPQVQPRVTLHPHDILIVWAGERERASTGGAGFTREPAASRLVVCGTPCAASPSILLMGRTCHGEEAFDQNTVQGSRVGGANDLQFHGKAIRSSTGVA